MLIVYRSIIKGRSHQTYRQQCCWCSVSYWQTWSDNVIVLTLDHTNWKLLRQLVPNDSSFPDYMGSPTIYSEVCVAHSLLFWIALYICRSLFVFLSVFFWSLCYLSFFHLRLLITPLLPSNSAIQKCNEWATQTSL
jgi:hypothetical protein